MAFKFVLLATLVAAASAGLLPVAHHGAIATSHSTIQHHAAPAIHHVGSIHAAPAVYQHTIAQPTIIKSVEHHAPANYEFSYSVHDQHTGDIKSQHETRHGDEVHGQYSLLDSDGHHRIVDYHADHHSGFNAVVRREPSGVKIAQPVHKVIAQPVHVSSYAHAPVAHATIQHHHAAPIAHYSAPIAHHAAPIAHHVAPIAHHVAPIAHYSAPIAHHAAPIAHSSSSIVHGTSHLSHHHYQFSGVKVAQFLDNLVSRTEAVKNPQHVLSIKDADHDKLEHYHAVVQSVNSALSYTIMAFKFVLLATLVAAASAGLLPVAHHGAIATSHSTIQHHAAPAIHHVGSIHAAPAVYQHTIAQPTIIKSVEHHAPANYEFSYSVHDQHTGDIKSQHETRHGDEVHGQYSLLDSDGHHRIVDYHADHHSGFNAVVRREPSGVKIAQPVHKVIAQPVHVSSYAHAPVAHATIQHHHAAPIAHYSAPIAHHAAPIAHHVAPIAHHVAPIAHYSAPIAHHAAPIAHSSSSIVHGTSHLSHHHY
ncbi:uncharacterized protein LOC128724147 [Anopheles nili]|uniref:uncharacterized protein LOC128724147 n=1 Tax=Anopheles nili TaxID=185578 RepID=UPI00237B6126|nr:uncharacterized protein LOC128724147 [Anopheles nili]